MKCAKVGVRTKQTSEFFINSLALFYGVLPSFMRFGAWRFALYAYCLGSTPPSFCAMTTTQQKKYLDLTLRREEQDFSVRQRFAVCDLLDGYSHEAATHEGPMSFELMVGVLSLDIGQRYLFLIGMGEDYDWFLASRYWKIVATKVKEMAENKCAICAKSNRLEAHHRTYEHHLEEHNHLEDLICLCNSCHAKFHNKLPKWGASR